MLTAIELDDEPGAMRDEVDDVLSDRFLAAELGGGEAVGAQVFPEKTLGIRHLATELASEVAGHDELPLSLTLPRKGGGNYQLVSLLAIPPRGEWNILIHIPG
jgi:hypothetical protein